MTNRERKILIGVLVGFAAFGTWLFFYNRPHMDFFCQEDGFVEYSEAILYLFAGGFFAYMGAHKQFRNVWYWGYALMFLGVCGEEVSWGDPREFVSSLSTSIPGERVRVRGSSFDGSLTK